MKIVALAEARRISGRMNADAEAIGLLAALLVSEGADAATRLAAVEALSAMAEELRADLPAFLSSLARVRQHAPEVFEPMAAEMMRAGRMEPKTGATVADCRAALLAFLGFLDGMIAEARPYLSGELGVTYASPSSTVASC